MFTNFTGSLIEINGYYFLLRPISIPHIHIVYVLIHTVGPFEHGNSTNAVPSSKRRVLRPSPKAVMAKT